MPIVCVCVYVYLMQSAMEMSLLLCRISFASLSWREGVVVVVISTLLVKYRTINVVSVVIRYLVPLVSAALKV